MKLNTDKFEDLAKRKGYKNGFTFWKRIGGGESAYELLAQGNEIGHEIVKDLFNLIGEKELKTVVNFEKETINGFKARYIEINGKLY